MAINNILLKLTYQLYAQHFGLSGGTWIPSPTPAYLWRDVAYPGARQAGHNHIPTRLIYEGMTWGIKK